MQLKLHSITIEELVPEEHFLRKLEKTINFSFIYDEVRELYCLDNGRPGIDPVMLIKYLLVGYLYGIESERRIEQEIQVNMAYRWFLGLDIGERVPDHSTISQNRRRRFHGERVFRRVFERVLWICMEKGLVDGKLILTDSTHVKANASRKSEHKVLVEKQLGLGIEAVGVDSAYNISLVHQELMEKNIRVVTPANDEAPTYKAELEKKAFTYDNKRDCFLCPMGKDLPLRRLQRSENNVTQEYRAERKDCRDCPIRSKCLTASQPCRRIQVNIFEDAVKKNHEGDGTPEHKAVLDLRQIWCEGSFAAQKARHNLRRLFRRGLEAAEDHCLLSATALNLKRMVKCLG